MKIFIYIFISVIPLKGFSQSFADKRFYLVDSLNLEELSSNDLQLLDSSLTAYHNSKHDTDRLKALALIPLNMIHSDWSKYSYLIINLTKNKLKENPKKPLNIIYTKIYANAINDIGVMYYYKGDFDSSLVYYNKSLKIRKEIKDLDGIATSLCNIGVVFKNQGRISSALEYYFQSLKIIERIGGRKGKADVLHNIGSIYESQEDVPNAIKYYLKSIELEKINDNKTGLAGSYLNIGFVYQRQGEFKKAREYFLESKKIYQEMEDQSGVGDSYIGIGIVCYGEKDYENSLINYKKALTIKQELGQKRGLVSVLIKIGYAYFKIGNLSLAKKYAHQGLDIAYNINSPQNIQTTAKLLSLIYKQEKNYKKGWEMYELHRAVQDSISNLNLENEVIKRDTKYQIEKKEQELQLQKKNIEVLVKDKKLKNYTLYGLLGFIFLLLISTYLWFRNYKFKKTIEETEIRHQLDIYIKEIELLKRDKEQTNVQTPIKKNLIFNVVDSLSERELEVFDELSKGKSNKEIADSLFVSTNTIKTHLKNIFEKLDVKNRIQAVKKIDEF